MSIKAEATRLLDTQLQFINYYKSRHGMRYMAAFIGDMLKKGQMRVAEHKDPIEYAAETGLRIAYEMTEALGYATSFYITDEMFDLNFHAAEQLPSVVFREDDLPADAGFVMMPRPLLTRDVHHDNVATRAFCWWKTTMRLAIVHESEDRILNTPAMIFAAFSTKADVELDDAYKQMRAEHPESWLQFPQWALAHWTYIFFDEAMARVEGMPGAFVQSDPIDRVKMNVTGEIDNKIIAEEREARFNEKISGTQEGSWYSFLRSFMLLVKQKVAVGTPEYPDRAGRRRWAAAGLPPEYGQIEVVTLRKTRPTNLHEIEGDSEGWEGWTHRWLVSGHWHNYWVGSGADRHLEPRWLETYEKGPADKPLIIKDKVFVWKR